MDIFLFLLIGGLFFPPCWAVLGFFVSVTAVLLIASLALGLVIAVFSVRSSR